MARKPSNSKAASRKPPTEPLLEWMAAGIGLVLILFVVVVLGREAVVGDASPPRIEVSVVRVHATDGGYLAVIEARNEGGEPAAEVVVEGRLQTGETAGATFAYIADHSAAEGGLFFETDPRRGGLALAARSYRTP